MYFSVELNSKYSTGTEFQSYGILKAGEQARISKLYGLLNQL